MYMLSVQKSVFNVQFLKTSKLFGASKSIEEMYGHYPMWYQNFNEVIS